MSIQQLPQLPPYIRLCEVIIQYTDREETIIETYLDLDLSVEDQVFEVVKGSVSQIRSFTWRDLETPPCRRNERGHYLP
jgi:hypothetical protein